MTMYTMPQSLLYDNELNRYLINSSMIPNLTKNTDGSITLYLQNEAPSADSFLHPLDHLHPSCVFIGLNKVLLMARGKNPNW